MVRGEKRKTVVFNLDDPRESAMYDLASRANFSRLVKGYLSQELQRIQARRNTAQHIEAQQKTPSE